MAELEAYINHHYSQYNMDTRQQDPSNPNKRKKTSSTDTSDLQSHTTEIKVKSNSINNKLDLLVTLHEEIKELRLSLDFTHNYIEKLEQSNNSLQTTVKTLSEKMDSVIKDNKSMKETILDIQTRSMRDNLIFSSIPEHTPENPETLIKDFMKTQLKLPLNTVNQITSHCVHCLGSWANKSPRPIITKLEHYKHKELIKSKGKELKGTHYRLNDQVPRKINERRKTLPNPETTQTEQ